MLKLISLLQNNFGNPTKIGSVSIYLSFSSMYFISRPRTKFFSIINLFVVVILYVDHCASLFHFIE